MPQAIPVNDFDNVPTVYETALRDAHAWRARARRAFAFGLFAGASLSLVAYWVGSFIG